MNSSPANRGSILLALVVAVLAVGVLRVTASAYLSPGGGKEALAVAMTQGHPARAPPLLWRYGCAGCHTISAVPGAVGKVAPSLDHLRQRVYIAGHLQNTADNLQRWIREPQSLSPGSAMPDTGISADEARDVAAFLYAH
jgi:cytochrome c